MIRLTHIQLLFFLLQGVALFGQAHEQSDRYLLHKIEMETALREEIQQVVRDSLGFYWLRTANDLYRFDGNKVSNYPLDFFSLELPGIFSLAKDHQQMFWYYSVKWQTDTDVVQRVKQLRIFDPYRERVMDLKEYLPELPFAEDQITQISVTTDRILIVLNDRKVYEWSLHGMQYKFTAKPDKSILDICYCEAGKGYYFSSGRQLLYRTMSDSTQVLRSLPKDQPPVRLRCNRNALFYYHQKGNSRLNNAAFYHPATGRTQRLQTDLQLRFLDNQDDLWIFKEKKKLRVYRNLPDGQLSSPSVISFDDLELENDNFTAASIVDGNVWIPFFRDLVVLKEKQAFFDCYLADQQISVRDIYQDTDSTLLITTYRGHRYLNLNTGELTTLFRTFDDLSLGYGIAANQDVISLGMHSAKGLFLYDRLTGEEQVAPFQENKQAVFGHDALIPFIDKKGTIWVGLKRGLGRLEKAASHLQIIHAPPLRAITETRINSATAWEDAFWLSSNDGLFLFHPESASLIDSLDLLGDKAIVYAHPEDENHVWVIPENDHVYRWNRDSDQLDTLSIYREKWQNSIHAMLPDDFGAYWLPSNNGLFRYDTSDGVIDHFTDEDHLLPSNEFNKLAWEKLRDGRIALGGINGMILFDPAQFADRSFRPRPEPLQFTEIIEVRSGNEIQVPVSAYRTAGAQLLFAPGVDQIIFRFNYVDVFSPEINYLFRLDPENPDAGWHTAKGPQLIFNQLSDGKHLLEIGVRHPLNPNIVDRIGIHFELQPTWYRTWWMKIVYGLLILGCLRLLVQYRIRGLKKEKETLERIIQDRTAEIRADKQYIEEQKLELERLNSLKDKLFAILGHELRAPMLGVTNMSKKVAYLLRQNDPDLLEDVSTQLDRNAKNVAATLEGLLQWGRVLLDAREPVKSRIVLHAFLDRLIASAQEQYADKQLTVTHSVCTEEMVVFDKDALMIILRNLLNNACKFSSANTTIQLEFHRQPDGKSELRILDEGIGLPPDFEKEWEEHQLLTNRKGTNGEKGSGLGLHICRLLAEKNNASIYIRNRVRRGTRTSLVWMTSKE